MKSTFDQEILPRSWNPHISALPCKDSIGVGLDSAVTNRKMPAKTHYFLLLYPTFTAHLTDIILFWSFIYLALLYLKILPVILKHRSITKDSGANHAPCLILTRDAALHRLQMSSTLPLEKQISYDGSRS